MSHNNHPSAFSASAHHWLFDLGNSRFKCAPLENETCGPVRILQTHHGAQLPRGQCAWVASVADATQTAVFLQQLQTHFSHVQRVYTQRQCLELKLASTQPEKFGVDRFLALLAATQTQQNSLVVGVGTALTLDLIHHNGQHVGGRIAPSPATMRQALHQRAAQLPENGGNYSEFTDNTPDALASGCIGAALALIERSLKQAANQLSTAPKLLLHGGGAQTLLPLLPPDTMHRPFLVLEGLARWVRQANNESVLLSD